MTIPSMITSPGKNNSQEFQYTALFTSCLCYGSFIICKCLLVHSILAYCYISISVSSTPPQLQSTSVPGDREKCSESNSSAVIAVSAVSLLLIVTLITVIFTQCLLMLKMRKSKGVLQKDEAYSYEVVMSPTTMHKDVPIMRNEAYALNSITISSEEIEANYELVK